MSENPNELNEQEEQEPYVPSPVSRRIWAWMGLVYAVIIMLLLTYWIATGGLIEGITGIMLFPMLGAMSAQGFNNLRLCRRGEHSGNPALITVSAVVMALLSAISLVWGVMELMTRFGG